MTFTITVQPVPSMWGFRLSAYMVNNLLTPNQASGTDTLGNTTGFTASASTIASSTVAAAQGSRCLAVTSTGTIPGVALAGSGVAGLPVTGGATYTVCADYRADNTDATNFGVRCILYTYKADGAATSTASVSPVPTTPAIGTDWRTAQGSATLPADAAFMRPVWYLYSSAAPISTARFSLDRLGLWEGAGGSWAMPGAVLGTVDWYRADKGSDLYLGSGATLLDRACPLNEPITYFATNDTDLVVADPVTMAADLPVLSSTMYATAMPVRVQSYRPYRGVGASVWHPVIGRSDPFVSVFPATYPAGELVLRAADNTERTNLILLMQPGDPLLIRSTCPDRLDTFTFLMTTWEDPYAGQDAQGGETLLRINYQRTTEVDPAWGPPPDWTYQKVLDTYPTYQAVLDAFPTYLALANGVPG